ncbi:hypothetical protein HELRODRAFT_168272 [Helobdella robusta]|uniref:Reverse transcriptase domain-containing protein n=1 Tax=Helobdella robusta TaxID=6412 RepID=T1F0D8_HELRO|nr:hypothetical protein HELRODRAFT_168272 [Helobdella robusta]ESO09309.1 hypothetical protein HELRODRAFT_168272 [Helobdella robusta]
MDINNFLNYHKKNKNIRMLYSFFNKWKQVFSSVLSTYCTALQLLNGTTLEFSSDNIIIFPNLLADNLNNNIAVDTDSNLTTCCCGRRCKGRKEADSKLTSSPMQQKESPPPSTSTSPPTSSPPANNITNNKPLPGIKLPKTTTHWLEANAYFYSQIATLPNITDINNFTTTLQTLIYNYFASNYGTLNQKSSSITTLDKPINKLKSELKQLKLLGRNNHNFDVQISTLSKHIRSKISSAKAIKAEKTVNITSQLKQKFWATCEKLLNPTTALLPLFSVEEANKFFNKILKDPFHNKYRLPNWIEPLTIPSIACNTNPPMYNEIFSIIKKCKSKASPCPLDQMSIIILKKCPILRTILYLLLHDVVEPVLSTAFKSSSKDCVV